MKWLTMPGSRIHTPACAILSVAALTLPLVTPLTPGEAAQVAAGCALGVIVSPDQDLVNPLRRVPVIGWLWGAYWAMYRWAIPHRSKFSHAPLVGTLGRVVWLLPLWVAWWFVTGLGAGWIIAGLAVADFGHVALDAFWRTK